MSRAERRRQQKQTRKRAKTGRPQGAARHIARGRALEAEGKPAAAAAAYRRALGIDAGSVEALNHLGNALADQGKADEAVAAYRRALDIDPRSLAILNNLGNALRELGQLDEAIAHYRRALEVDGASPGTHNNLGNALASQGEAEMAQAAYREALKADPRFVDALYNLGNVLAGQGRADEAADAYRRAVAIDPGLAPAHVNLGNALLLQGKADEAVAAYRQALASHPNFAEAHYNLARALMDQGKTDEAAAAYGQALDIDPDNAPALNGLGMALKKQGRLAEAAAAFRRALDVDADFSEASNNLGNALVEQGRIDDAIASYRRALAVKPADAEVHSNLLLGLNYLADIRPKEIFEAHLEWGKAQDAAAEASEPPPPSRSPEAERLRVGYVSPDFRTHSVAYFLEPLLAAHDSVAFEVFCYPCDRRVDATTRRLRRAATHWRPIAGLSDEDALRLIREDGIDILVDVAGHTANNRLPLFARKPAPLQFSWLGYPNTTGLSAIDYRLTDADADPPGAEELHTEALIRLETGFLCYMGPGGGNEKAPDIGPFPCLENGYVTFASFNNLSKVTAEVVAAWSRILGHVADSRLLLKARALADGETRRACGEMFAAQGIAAERLELHGFMDNADDHLGLYGMADFALDPFPYNGTATTCEALWMGVPVVSLSGERHAGRVGTSILNRLGLSQFAAATVEEYVRTAVGLAGRVDELAELRLGLRTRMKASPLGDAAAFAGAVEDAYRKAWAGLGEG
ncbi:MAG: tetratricopeptide repeat protein [Rhodospirillales bacterium]|nr:tetratricopeptide repeat protein [Rhodospirillales bacterium]